MKTNKYKGLVSYKKKLHNNLIIHLYSSYNSSFSFLDKCKDNISAIQINHSKNKKDSFQRF